VTEAEVLELALHGATRTIPETGSGVCALCGEGVQGELALLDPFSGRPRPGVVHASCAAPVLARAHAAAGREPLRHVSGVACGVCRRSFRYNDQVVVVGREGCKTALHVRRCTPAAKARKA
jgi:hypothetical protein